MAAIACAGLNPAVNNTGIEIRPPPPQIASIKPATQEPINKKTTISMLRPSNSITLLPMLVTVY
ncbi:hypothetical protein [Moraxella lacunata]|uniref:hypothetical protein n=1 Tax=Moraxella lacunata TaxID=477 RepID=UPI003EE0EC2A